jgi:hypothetical protein
MKMNLMRATLMCSVAGVIAATLTPATLPAEEDAAGPASSIDVLWQQTSAPLVSTNVQKRLDAANKLIVPRRELIKNLMEIINSTNSMEVKVPVAVVLGRYHATQVIPFLVTNLEWEAHLPSNWRKYEGSYGMVYDYDVSIEIDMSPISSPLFNIGMPAIKPVLDKMLQTDDLETIRLCADICKSIEGKEVTQFRLQGLLNKESDPKKKERIQSALDALKHPKGGIDD